MCRIRLDFRVNFPSHFSQMNFWPFLMLTFFVFIFRSFFLWIFSCCAKFSLCRNNLLQIGHEIPLFCTFSECWRLTWRLKWAGLENWILQHTKLFTTRPTPDPFFSEMIGFLLDLNCWFVFVLVPSLFLRSTIMLLFHLMPVLLTLWISQLTNCICQFICGKNKNGTKQR